MLHSLASQKQVIGKFVFRKMASESPRPLGTTIRRRIASRVAWKPPEIAEHHKSNQNEQQLFQKLCIERPENTRRVLENTTMTTENIKKIIIFNKILQ